MRRKLKKLAKKYSEGKIKLDKIRCVIASWLGHAKHANSYRVTQKVLDITFYKTS